MYEKVKKTPLRLEFDSAEKQQEILSKFNLTTSLWTPETKMEEEVKSELEEEIEEKLIDEKK